MKRFPNALIVMIGAIILAWILTYIIPQGKFQRVTDEHTQLETVIPNSYSTVETQSLSFIRLLMAIPEGLIGRADLIFLIVLSGGCFFVIEQTGALKQGLTQLTSKMKGKEEIALIIISLLFAAGGVFIGLQEEIIAMTPVILYFTRSLGYNAFVAVASSFGSAVLGSSFSPMNPFAVGVAQKEAGLELLSGSGYRIIILLLAFTLWMIIIIRYANKNRIEKVVNPETSRPLSIREGIILMLLMLAFILLTYGIVSLGWGFNEISAMFFFLGIISGLIGRLGLNGTSESYIAGFKEMIFAGVIVGLANSITIILKEGMIIDSIVYGLFIPTQYLPKTASAVSMMVAHSLLHFPVPSYSGQAIMTMPILIPLSDLLGISRQVCVLAYQYGAVMMDNLIPTNGGLMAILALAGISYDKWFKFALKPTLYILFFAGLAIIVAIGIGYS